MNITLRHMVGGFIGGTIGLLLMHFVGFWWMCGGCTVGFIMGFWAPEIWVDLQKPVITTEQWAAVQNKTSGFFLKIRNDWEELITRLQRYRQKGAGFGQKIAGGLGIFFVKMIPNVVVWLIRGIISSPRKLLKFFRAHPINRSRLVLVCLFLGWCAFLWFATSWLCSHYPSYTKNQKTGVLQTDNGNWIMLSVVMIVGAFFYCLATNNEEGSRTFYQRYELWSKSPLLFAGVELFKIACSSIALVLFLTFGLAGMMGGVLFGIAKTIAISFLCGMLQLLFNFSILSTRKMHWLGVIVTLAVTMLTAYFTKGSRTDLTVWFIAFSNGILCGVISAALHRLSARVFVKSELVVFAYQDDIFDRNIESGMNAMARVGKSALQLFAQKLVIDY